LVIDSSVKQALLRSVLPDGTVVLLVVLHDDRCAVLRNNEIVHEARGDADGIDGAVQRFMAMTQVSDVLGGDGDGDDNDNDNDNDNDDRAEATSAAPADGASRPQMTRDANPPAPQASAAGNLTPPAAAPRP
jgi:hypothetical protein